MSLSCFLRRAFSSVLKGPVLGNVSKRLAQPSCSVYFLRQPYHQLVDTKSKEPVEWRLNATKFSTSSALLAQHKGHDHSKLWTLERLLSAGLLPLVPAALMYPSQALDTALAFSIVLHTHFGLEAIVVDYIRPILFGELVPKIGMGLLYLFSIVTLAGLLNLIYNDAGLANTILEVWKS